VGRVDREAVGVGVMALSNIAAVMAGLGPDVQVLPERSCSLDEAK